MPLYTISINSAARKISLIGALLVAIAANYFFGKWALANMAASHADLIEVAQLAEQLGPGDPQTHYATAVLLEKGFLPDDIAGALSEYAQAAALSPNNYLLWLDLGNARARDGDLIGAERSLRIAEELAPAYSSVQWALGNVLLRQGKMTEAFICIHKAAASDPQYAAAGANVAWQYFEGDVDRIRGAVGDSPEIIAALIPLLASEKRVAEALTLWNALGKGKSDDLLQRTGKTLSNDLVDAKRFRDAAQVESEILGGEQGAPGVGKITNGDFEGEIRTQRTSSFEWTIADGAQPKIALADGQKHGGGRSLLLAFGADGTNDFRQIAQTIALEPGRAYELTAFYRSDLQTSASIQWEIVNASDGKVLAATEKLTQASDWKPLTVSFTVPQGVDGVILRLAKNGCGPAGCPATGKVWFDDIALTAK